MFGDHDPNMYATSGALSPRTAVQHLLQDQVTARDQLAHLDVGVFLVVLLHQGR